MQKCLRLLTKKPGTPSRRTVLCVDPDKSYAIMLHRAWSQLRLADDLHIVSNKEAALKFLTSVQSEHRKPLTAAVVLDPEATAEETGPFLRDVRKQSGKQRIPIVFWSRDSDKYEVLVGRGVESVLKKPKVLRLIQSLDAICQLSVKHFHPFAEND